MKKISAAKKLTAADHKRLRAKIAAVYKRADRMNKKISATISKISKRRPSFAVWPASDDTWSVTDLAKVLHSYDIDNLSGSPKTFAQVEEFWKVASGNDRRGYRKLARRILVLLNKRPLP